MSVFSSRTPSLTPSRSPTPALPTQPDHFYGSDVQLPPSPDSDGKTWLDPEDDPLAQRGIPVFKPTMAEFQDFEGYMKSIEPWGMRSGIVKVVPPKEWRDALPPVEAQLADVEIKTPIEQQMLGGGGLFRQTNISRRKMMTVREWAEMCGKDEFRAPGVEEVGPYGAHTHASVKSTRNSRRSTTRRATTVKAETDEVVIKDEPLDDAAHALLSPPHSSTESDHPGEVTILDAPPPDTTTPAQKKTGRARRQTKTQQTKNAELAARGAANAEFLTTFRAHHDWLPPKTTQESYTPEFCAKLERQYWRNLGLGKPAWYGADTSGSLFTEATTAWNVAHLPSVLSRLLPSSGRGLPGVNTPYLYFGMWRATFAWHVEDMDLFSINYIHFGAGKHWYAIPQGRAGTLEQTMKGYFPKDISQCPQFLRHKSFLASPNQLSKSLCKPNTLVQHAGEFVITYPRGYHAGFNLGFNCAESVNFALESWIDLARKAKVCHCVGDSVQINVDDLIREREEEALEEALGHNKKKHKENARPRKRKAEGEPGAQKSKKARVKEEPVERPKLTFKLKLGPRPKEDEFVCCLCVSPRREGLLRVVDLPAQAKEYTGGLAWAHEGCANVVPETWVDEVETGEVGEDGMAVKERMVYGVDGIVKDRWNLKCNACTKPRNKAHGAPIQCTKGKCPKAFHVSCAREGGEFGIIFSVVREVEKEVVLLGDAPPPAQPAPGHPLAQEEEEGPEPDPMAVDRPAGPTVLKIIKKTEVQLLCSQHNPAKQEAKKSAKQDKMKQHLLGLAPDARIKIRVSAGVFEVTLIRVIAETGSVEVLWDRGVRREFKWSSVLLGNAPEGVTVAQMPTEAAATLPVVLPPPAPAVDTLLSQPVISTAAQWDALFAFQRQKNTFWPVDAAPMLQVGSTRMQWPMQTQQQQQGDPSNQAQVQTLAGPSTQAQAGPSNYPQAGPSTCAQPGPSTYAQPGPSNQMQPQPGPSNQAQPGPSNQSQPGASNQPQPVQMSWPVFNGFAQGGQPYGPTTGMAMAMPYLPQPMVYGAQGGSADPAGKYRNGQVTWQTPYAGPGQKAGAGADAARGSATPAPAPAPPVAPFGVGGTGTMSYSQLAAAAAQAGPSSKS